MIKFLYGESIYLIDEELKKIEANFALTDPNSMNLSKLDGAELSFSTFCQQVDAMPFLAEKRLIVIKNLLLQGDNEVKEKVYEKLDSVNKNLVVELVVVEQGEPDKRSKLYKYLSKLPEVKEFATLKGFFLTDWMQKKARESGVELTREAAAELARAVPDDLLQISSEIEKLALYAESQERQKIVAEDILELTSYEIAPDMFQLIENIASKNEANSLKILNQFAEAGENEQKIMSMIAYQFKTLISIFELVKKGSDKNQISKEAGLHPFVVTKAFPLLKKYSWNELLESYDLIANFDFRSKTGEIGAEMLPVLVVKLSK